MAAKPRKTRKALTLPKNEAQTPNRLISITYIFLSLVKQGFKKGYLVKFHANEALVNLLTTRVFSTFMTTSRPQHAGNSSPSDETKYTKVQSVAGKMRNWHLTATPMKLVTPAEAD